ncbi:unnamed protein product [Cyclocybe aegerita]|uniref:Rhomboid-type serine protease n=1 Tax=Cyclocybe aegerita TaxID=1973307 RepID=A0A8S0WJE6_CYCAE|nr:unnamed protein product [Cyclocybe aegerita]
MASSQPATDSKTPYVVDYTPEPSTSTSTTNNLVASTSQRRHSKQDPMNDDYDPTNVGVPRAQHTSDASDPTNLNKDLPAAPSVPSTKEKRLSSYSDDDGHGHSNEQPTDDTVVTPLVRGKSQKRVHYQDLEYGEPHSRAGLPPSKEKPLAKFFASAKYPLDQRIENKKRGIGRQKYPVVVYTLTVAMIGVFIYELVLNAREQGNPFSFRPVVNYMLGPSSSALVNLGARFPPCMKYVEAVPPSTPLGCMNNTANPVTEICTVEELCGFGGIPPNETPDQWFRFITAIFLHAGVVHILINMLAQMILSAQIEREMGSGGFLITYFAAGIFGNVLGGNFSLVGIPSVGASGAIFGTLAVTWVDLFAHWKFHYRPVKKLVFMTIELLIGFAIGYIPYVDNFAHIGGFVMGLLVATVFYPVISTTNRHRFIMWAFRLAAIPFAILLFVLLTRNFYTSDPYDACSGCRYLSCIPSSANNRCQGTGLST